jgi:uncharacterized protein YceK
MVRSVPVIGEVFCLRRVAVCAVVCLALSGCASLTKNTTPALEATLTRGGGLSGFAEVVRLWSTPNGATGEYHRTDQQHSRAIGGTPFLIGQMLRVIDSLAEAPPPQSLDTGGIRRVCDDVVTSSIRVRHRKEVRTIQQMCPAQDHAVLTYWSKVDTVFTVLVKLAHQQPSTTR